MILSKPIFIIFNNRFVPLIFTCKQPLRVGKKSTFYPFNSLAWVLSEMLALPQLEGIGLSEEDISIPEDSDNSISDFEKRMEEKYGK